MKHVVCYSGGIVSAKTAKTVVRRVGTENVILLNHNISAWVEHPDIKRYKVEVAEQLGLPVTYANIGGEMDDTKIPDQFDVCVAAKAFKVGVGTELCTNRLKTAEFMRWLEANVKPGEVICYYGFDGSEMDRVERRQRIMGALGYATAYPLADGSPDAVTDHDDIGVLPPITYALGWKHGNCVGCLKAGMQHWYKVWIERRDVWDKGKWAERMIGYTIHRRNKQSVRLLDLEPQFQAMEEAGVVATEATPPGKFWAGARKAMRTQLAMATDPQLGLFNPCDGCQYA